MTKRKSIRTTTPERLTTVERAELYRIHGKTNVGGTDPFCTRLDAVVRYQLASAGCIVLQDGMWVCTPMGKAAL